jgi:hypothetical protein
MESAGPRCVVRAKSEISRSCLIVRSGKKAIHRLWHAFFRFSAWFTNRRVTADHSGPTADPPIPSRSVFSIGYPGGIMRTAQHHRFAGFLIVMILSFLILGLGMVLAGTTL